MLQLQNDLYLDEIEWDELIHEGFPDSFVILTNFEKFTILHEGVEKTIQSDIAEMKKKKKEYQPSLRRTCSYQQKTQKKVRYTKRRRAVED